MRPRLDGTNIYMTLARLFLAHATNTPLAFGQEMSVLAIAMLQVGRSAARDNRHQEIGCTIAARVNGVFSAEHIFGPIRGIIMQEDPRAFHQTLRVGSFEILAANRDRKAVPSGHNNRGWPDFDIGLVNLVWAYRLKFVMRMKGLVRSGPRWIGLTM
jgi:hypothetical protein